MTENEIRTPIQKRSIEKKEKIIEEGFKLICEKGYYNTNTAEIAKAAGVSTGIIYNYFKDKHDILIEGLHIYVNDIFNPMINLSDDKLKHINSNTIHDILYELIQILIKKHTLSTSSHEEIMAMTHTDKEVASLFHQTELNTTKKIVNILNENNIHIENTMERVHIAIGLVDNLCHEIIYHKHENMNYEIMTQLVIQSIINLIELQK